MADEGRMIVPLASMQVPRTVTGWRSSSDSIKNPTVTQDLTRSAKRSDSSAARRGTEKTPRPANSNKTATVKGVAVGCRAGPPYPAVSPSGTLYDDPALSLIHI